MTDTEKIAMLKSMTGETDADTLSTYLLLAKNVILYHAYPFSQDETELPKKYDGVHVEVAAYMLNKRGAEGETLHKENGISRGYESGDIPASLLRRITPMTGRIHNETSEP